MATLVHVNLLVRDIDRSLEFYVGALGGAVVDDATITGPIPEFYSGGRSASMRIVMVKPSSALFGVMIELMQLGPSSKPSDEAPRHGAPSIANLSFLVDSLAASLGSLEDRGVEAASEVFEITLPKTGASAIAFVRDPDGNLVELVERRKPTAS